jgi:hypothetical protein
MTTGTGLARPDDVYQALMDAQADLGEAAAEKFRARLILVLADRIGDDRVVIDAIATARRGLAEGEPA